MQVDQEHLALYAEKAPEILDTIDHAACLMKRVPDTDGCIQLTGGLCNIQSTYSTAFLSDPCHFYPRITRKIGDKTLMTAALSCPEVTRLILFSEAPFHITSTVIDRLPGRVINPVPETMTSTEAEQSISLFLTMAADSALSPESIMIRLLSIARTLSNTEHVAWAGKIKSLFLTADRLTIDAASKVTDPVCILYALVLLLASAPKAKRQRLHDTITTMAKALDCTINWETREIIPGATGFAAYSVLKQRWEQQAEAALAPVLRRWIQAQLAMAAFPFGKFSTQMWERSIILSVRFATVKLALMCHMEEDGTPPDMDTVIRVVQSISRFLDHLADTELSLTIYTDAGWMSKERMVGLIQG